MRKEIQIVKNQVKLKNWAKEIESCSSSGMTVKQWCEIKGMSVKTYYYHLRKVREAILSENCIVSLGTQQIIDNIEISAENMKISLPAGCSSETLRTVLTVLKDAQ